MGEIEQAEHHRAQRMTSFMEDQINKRAEKSQDDKELGEFNAAKGSRIGLFNVKIDKRNYADQQVDCYENHKFLMPEKQGLGIQNN